jgi:alpha-tubulin suppressor-like RCC1 family protein
MSPPRPIPLPVSSDLPPVVEVAAGATHTCARTPGGQIWCWGANGYGELGDGTTTARPTPRPAAFEGTAVEVDTSFSRTCARRDDGSVWCWGWGAWGQLGNTAEVNLSKPERVRGLAMAVEVTNGNNHSCARRADRTVWCWGRNESGQIGTGSTSRGVDSAAQVQGLSDAVAVTAGGSHSCARRADGTVWCWGGNVSGELGVAPAGPGQHRAVAVQVPGLTDVVAIAAGGVHTCALRADGTIWCWGDNANGELGDGTRTSRPAPARALLSCP